MKKLTWNVFYYDITGNSFHNLIFLTMWAFVNLLRKIYPDVQIKQFLKSNSKVMRCTIFGADSSGRSRFLR